MPNDNVSSISKAHNYEEMADFWDTHSTADYADQMQEVEITLEIEYLAKTVDFSDELVRFGEDLKKDWWQQHKQEFLKGTAYERCE